MDGGVGRYLLQVRGVTTTVIAGLVLIMLIGQCTRPAENAALPLTQFRRSVLDQQVRMLTLRYGEDQYVAYSLADPPHIYKVWRGGVTWNGTNYNNLKEIQPESYGEQYLLHPKPRYVLESQNGSREELTLEHGSYVVDDGGLTFHFGVMNPGLEACKIIERPGFYYEDGGLVFHRTYAMEGFEPGSTIFVDSVVMKAQQSATLLYPLDSVPPTSHPGEASIASSSHYWLSKSGCNTCHAMDYKMVGPSYHEIANAYEADKSTLESLTAKVKNGATGTWGDAVMIPHPDLPLADIENMVKGILTLAPKDKAKVLPPKRKDLVTTDQEIPGFGSVVTDVHPSFTLETIRPSDFRPRVGSLEFGSGGELYVGTWDSIGAIYQLTGVETSDTNMIEVTKIATGLAEPLGMEVVGSDLYVMQKHELTQLLDHDGDGTIDEYKSINNDFDVTTDFHEFAYDIEFMDGYFYGTLGLAMRLMTIERQLPQRGTAFKVNHSGDFQILANGLRQPNGIGIGVDGELFTTENQGRWVPCCKLIHIRPGDFHGCLSGQGDRFDGMEMTPPAVWLPQGEIGNSPGEALLMTEGPYAGQMMFGDVSHGGINRAYLEKVDGAYQGCVFRFCQGLEAGVNRIVRGPDDALYIGGVGMTGGWSHNGRQFGLQKLVFNGNVPFEMLGIRATVSGFDVEFTHPIPQDTKLEDLALNVSQWYYKPTAAYGGPKLDEHDLKVDRMEISKDGTILHLDIRGRKLGYVVYLFFNRSFLSADGKSLRSGEAWYTLNAIPEEVL